MKEGNTNEVAASFMSRHNVPVGSIPAEKNHREKLKRSVAKLS